MENNINSNRQLYDLSINFVPSYLHSNNNLSLPNSERDTSNFSPSVQNHENRLTSRIDNNSVTSEINNQTERLANTEIFEIGEQNSSMFDIFNFQSDFVNNNHEYINMHNSIYEIDDLLFSSNYF